MRQIYTLFLMMLAISTMAHYHADKPFAQDYAKKFILADEPTANLDSSSTRELLEIMQKMNEESKITFLFSTHDQRVVDKARRIITIDDGKVASDERIK